MRVHGAFVLLQFIGVFAVVACSPASAHRELADAQNALTRAEQQGAARSAAYEHMAAIEYLKKAREEDAHAEFEAARNYAKRSIEFSRKAETRAAGARQGFGYRQPEPIPPPPPGTAQAPTAPPLDDNGPIKRRPSNAQ